MIVRAASILLVGAVTFALAGCVTPREPPPSLSAEDLELATEQRIDLAWAHTGLEGTVERPDVVPTAERTFDDLATCIADLGVVEWSMSDSPQEVGLDAISGLNTVEVQLGMYECFALHPVATMSDVVPLTRDQLDYLYDYYSTWLIPCLASKSIPVTQAPTREEFRTPIWQGWSPYSAAISITTPDEYDAIVSACGGPYADLALGGAEPGSASSFTTVFQ